MRPVYPLAGLWSTMKTARDNKGIGLVALIAAIAILAIALSAGVTAFIGSSNLMKQANNLDVASNFAEDVIEHVRVQPFTTIVSTDITANLPSLPNARCHVDVKVIEKDLKEIIVTFTWLERARERKVSYATLVAGGAR
jgi:type II secretory pathway pseudopilin PulG